MRAAPFQRGLSGRTALSTMVSGAPILLEANIGPLFGASMEAVLRVLGKVEGEAFKRKVQAGLLCGL